MLGLAKLNVNRARLLQDPKLVAESTEFLEAIERLTRGSSPGKLSVLH